MSTLEVQSNPFLVHGRSHSDNNFIKSTIRNKDSSLTMPRTYSPPESVSTPSINRKRKFEDNLLATPEHQLKGALITPPRSNKRSKTVPSSPTHELSIYETPKTPSFKQNFHINIGNLQRSPQSPEYQITKPLSSSSSSETNFTLSRTNNVTPPQSNSSSPVQNEATLISPTITPKRVTQNGEYSYMYADTCYPFNIGGSAIGRSEGNLRLKTWRDACNEKVRHEYNKALKDFNALSSKLKKESLEKMSEKPLNPPALLNSNVFPTATKLSKMAFRELNYPFASNIDNSQEKIESEAHLLLNFKNSNTEQKPTYPLKKSSNIQLPPISEIFKFTPFDKSTVHPSGLSTLEINQYQNTSTAGIIFDKNAKYFYGGQEIKKNMPIPVEANSFNNDLSAYSIQNLNQPQTPYEQPATILPLYTPPVITQPAATPQLQSPIRLKLKQDKGADAYDDLSEQIKDLSDEENSKKEVEKSIKSFQTQFKTQPLKVTKTRRESVLKVTKSKLKVKKTSRSSSSSKSSPVTSNNSSRVSSRSSSRKSSNSKAIINDLNTGKKMRTRSSSNKSRQSSTDSVKTAEAPASIETTPKTSPVVNKSQTFVNNSNTVLFPPQYESDGHKIISNNHHNSHYLNNKVLDFSKSTVLAVPPINSQFHMGNSCLEPHIHSQFHNHHDHYHQHFDQPTQLPQPKSKNVKRCMSCFTTSSPCWRPSWAPEDGQLCNSCGLRYRKTKARCYNPRCLKIPSKSEWALMTKRGQVLLDIYDSQGNVIGRKMSYRCLDCDSAMEVLR